MCCSVGRQLTDRNRKRFNAVRSVGTGKGELKKLANLFKLIFNEYLFQVYQLISRRRFQQMEVLEGQNILVTISGKKNRVRVYYLSWLKSKILRTDGLSDVS